MDLLRKEQYSDITVKKLVEAADLNRSTFYLHYYDINAVFEELIDEMFEDISQDISDGKLGLEEIGQITGKMEQAVRSNSDYALLFTRGSDYPYFAQSMFSMMKKKVSPESLANLDLNDSDKEFLMTVISYMTCSLTGYMMKTCGKEEISEKFNLLKKYLYMPVLEKILH